MAMINTNLPLARIQDPNQSIASLEARVAQLERALQVSATGAVTIKSTHSMSIEAGSQLEIRCPGTVKILAGGQLRLKGASIAQN